MRPTLRVVLGCLALTVIGGGVGYLQGRRIPPPLTGRLELLKDPRYLDMLDRCCELIGKQHSDPRALFRAVLDFVRNNSLHLIDQEYRRYVAHREVTLALMLAAAKNPDAPKPHLSCGPRAQLMRDILFRFGITARLVQVFSDDGEQVEGHRLLEVFNPETKVWELWDPDYGVSYEHRETGEPLGVTDLVMKDLGEVTPRGGDGKGWNETGATLLREHYFEAVAFEAIEDTSKSQNDPTILVNTNRIETSKRSGAGETFEEWARRAYGRTRLIEFPGVGK